MPTDSADSGRPGNYPTAGFRFKQLCPGKALAENAVTGVIRAMRLENMFGDIKSDRSSVSHGRLLQVDDQLLHLGT
jgi:hypothetical protein